MVAGGGGLEELQGSGAVCMVGLGSIAVGMVVKVDSPHQLVCH